MSCYVGSGNWQGFTEEVQRLKDVQLVGRSEDATVIYAGVHPHDGQENNRALLAGRISELLGFMGVESEIVHSSIPVLLPAQG